MYFSSGHYIEAQLCHLHLTSDITSFQIQRAVFKPFFCPSPYTEFSRSKKKPCIKHNNFTGGEVFRRQSYLMIESYSEYLKIHILRNW